MTPPVGQAGPVAALRQLGYEQRSISELRTSGHKYRDAVPVLLDWLTRVDQHTTVEIVRALSVPWARPAAVQPLLDLFRQASDDNLRWVVGNALEVVADDSVFDQLASLASDRSYGTGRQMLVLRLGKSKRPEAAEVLQGLAEDPDVDGHVVLALSRKPVASSRPILQAKLEDQRAWVRRAARRGVDKLDRENPA